MCASIEKTTVEKLEVVESEIAHLIADALFVFMSRTENGKESPRC